MTITKISQYWKAIIATVPFVIALGNVVVGALQNASSDGHISSQDVLSVVITAVTALGVLLKRNAELEETV